VSKCHLIYDRPEDRLKQILIPRIQRLCGASPSRFYKEFWALRDVSVQVDVGETIGIIGRNGAGKSTLLQILCGTLNPTTGSVQTKGRIAALLELGSGFNPEFTGRENVYLNAAVLGLTRQEIDTRFDDIAAFADIGDFIDRPVKTYSSGMFVRLAFAVIAHVNADILVIDEALAVGDVVFTQKCMRFLRRFKKEKTLVFVSHDIHSIINLCDRAMWLDHGMVRMLGGAKEVAEAYIQDANEETRLTSGISSQSHTPRARDTASPEPLQSQHSSPKEDAPRITLFDGLGESAHYGKGHAKITSVTLRHSRDNKDGIFRGGDPVRLEIAASISERFESPIIGFAVKDRLGQWLFGQNTYECSNTIPEAISGRTLVGIFDFDLPWLPSGSYSMLVSIAEGTPFNNTSHHWIHDAVVFNVVGTKPGLGLMGIPFNSISLTYSVGL
jgi:lipopolysaccharide transport system ATP-binding protein